MFGLLALVCAATAGAATHGHLTPGEQKEHAEEALQAAKRHHQEFAAAVHQRERKAALQEKLSRLEGPASAGPHEVARQDTTVLRMPAMETDSVTGLTFVGRRKLFRRNLEATLTVTEDGAADLAIKGLPVSNVSCSGVKYVQEPGAKGDRFRLSDDEKCVRAGLRSNHASLVSVVLHRLTSSVAITVAAAGTEHVIHLLEHEARLMAVRQKKAVQKRAAVSRTVTETPTPYGMDYVFEVSGASGPTLCLAAVAAALVALLA